MNKIVILAVVSVIGFRGVAEPEKSFAMSSLVLPQGVSYTLGPVMLTRVLESATAERKAGETIAQSKTDDLMSRRAVVHTDTLTHEDKFASGMTIGGAIGGDGSNGNLAGMLGVKVDVGGKFASEDSRRSSTTDSDNTETSSQSGRKNSSGSSSESADVERYGSYHLKFTVSFKNKTPGETYLVGGKGARVLLNGFSIPLAVPYTEYDKPIVLGSEERVLFFDYPLRDQELLRDAKRFAESGCRNAVTLKLIGDEFPVISERTKENAISSMAHQLEVIPNTEMSISFGDARKHSPWRLRRRFPKDNPMRGKKVTVRDALESLGSYLSSDVELGDDLVVMNDKGTLDSICDRPIVGGVKANDLNLVAVWVDPEIDGEAFPVHLPNKAFLQRYLSEFRSIRFVMTTLSDIAMLSSSASESISDLEHEVEDLLAESKGGLELWRKLKSGYAKEADKTEEVVKESVKKNAEPKAGTEKTFALPDGGEIVFCFCPADGNQFGKGFWMGKYEITQAQWRTVMGEYSHASYRGKELGDKKPAIDLGLGDCTAFCDKLSSMIGARVSVPTVEEWEYACYAGAGDLPRPLDDYAWCEQNSGRCIHDVGEKRPNAWGLHDMCGNADEWTRTVQSRVFFIDHFYVMGNCCYTPLEYIGPCTKKTSYPWGSGRSGSNFNTGLRVVIHSW